jgi:hypothetical protein
VIDVERMPAAQTQSCRRCREQESKRARERGGEVGEREKGLTSGLGERERWNRLGRWERLAVLGLTNGLTGY